MWPKFTRKRVLIQAQTWGFLLALTLKFLQPQELRTGTTGKVERGYPETVQGLKSFLFPFS